MRIYILILFTIISCLQASTILIHETFNNNNNNWELFNDNISATKIHYHGYYEFENRQNDASKIIKKFNLTNKDNFSISLTVGFNWAYYNKYYSGLVLIQNDEKEYFFGISENLKKFIVYKMENDQKTILFSSKYEVKNSREIVLGIKKNQGNIYFLIDKKIYAKTKIKNFDIVKMGFFVEGKQKVAFDNFTITKYNNSEKILFDNYATLTLNAPSSSEIKILNIKNKYKDGMLLKKGKYHIIVSKKGYNSYDRWVTINNDTALNIQLSKFTPTKAKYNTNGSIEWKSSLNPYPLKGVEVIGNTIWEKRNQHNVRILNWKQAKEYCENLKIQKDGFLIDNFKLPNLTQSKYRYKKRGGEKIGGYCSLWSRNFPYTFEFCSWGRGKKHYTDANDKYAVLCVSNGHFVFNKKLSVIDLANRLIISSHKRKQQIKLPPKPKILQYKKLKKGEFETTKHYKARVQKSHEKIDYKNKKNLDFWKKAVTNEKLQHQLRLKEINSNKHHYYLKALQQAMHIKYGAPKISKAIYNADQEIFEIELKSTKGGYHKKVKVPVKIKYARKFKALLLDKSFKPTIIFSVTNSKLHFKDIKEIQNPEQLVEENEYNHAYSIQNRTKSIKKLKEFIKKYPKSIYSKKAKKRIITLQEELRVIEENRAKEIAERQKRDAIAAKKEAERKQRKQDSFYAKKHVGEKVCMDGTVALFLSITITAYVENVNGNNIQLRISDTEGTTPNINGVTLYRNTLIWEDYRDWYKCNY